MSDTIEPILKLIPNFRWTKFPFECDRFTCLVIYNDENKDKK